MKQNMIIVKFFTIFLLPCSTRLLAYIPVKYSSTILVFFLSPKSKTACLCNQPLKIVLLYYTTCVVARKKLPDSPLNCNKV